MHGFLYMQRVNLGDQIDLLIGHSGDQDIRKTGTTEDPGNRIQEPARDSQIAAFFFIPTAVRVLPSEGSASAW